MLDREAKARAVRQAAVLATTDPAKALGPARGVVIGVLISLALWAGLIAGWTWR